LTKKLLNKMLPEKILRKTDEILNSDESLKRYEIIGDLLVKEYGYELTSHKEDRGINYWFYVRSNINESNINLDDNYVLDDYPRTYLPIKFYDSLTESIKKNFKNKKF